MIFYKIKLFIRVKKYHKIIKYKKIIFIIKKYKIYHDILYTLKILIVKFN